MEVPVEIKRKEQPVLFCSLPSMNQKRAKLYVCLLRRESCLGGALVLDYLVVTRFRNIFCLRKVFSIQALMVELVK